MLCAALLDAGLNEVQWREGLSNLDWNESAEITVTKTMRGVFAATHLNIAPPPHLPTSDVASAPTQHDHQHSHHHGAGHHHSHTHTRTGSLGPSSVSWSNHHRGFTEISNLIDNSNLPATVQQKAIQVFRVLGEAEASIHGNSLEDIHFHEVGAVDSILDIVVLLWTVLIEHYRNYSRAVPCQLVRFTQHTVEHRYQHLRQLHFTRMAIQNRSSKSRTSHTHWRCHHQSTGPLRSIP